MVAVILVSSCTDTVVAWLKKLEVLVTTRSVVVAWEAKDVEVETETGLALDVLWVTVMVWATEVEVTTLAVPDGSENFEVDVLIVGTGSPETALT